MANNSLFGVSVEEALTRSGIIDAIVEHLSTMSDMERQALEKDGDVLEQHLKTITTLKSQISQEIKLTKEYLRKSTQLKKVSSQTEYARKLVEQNILLDSHQKQINNEILAAFKLEHKILDTMSDGKTKTASYAIYFYGSQSGEIIRGEIKSEDLYDSKYLFVDNKGNIKISAQIIKAEKSFMQTTSSMKDGSLSTDAWDMNLAADLEALTKETYTFLKVIQDKYKDIKALASDIHLGLARDALYDTSRQTTEDAHEIFNLIQEKSISMYNYFFYKKEQRPPGRLNRGHLAEAYERILQARMAGKTAPSPYEALKQSLGDDPWYIAGDVGDVQVKTFFDKQDRRVASYSSIISLGYTLISIIKNTAKAASDILRQGTDRLKMKEQAKWLNANKKLEECLRQEVEAIFKAFDK